MPRRQTKNRKQFVQSQAKPRTDLRGSFVKSAYSLSYRERKAQQIVCGHALQIFAVFLQRRLKFAEHCIKFRFVGRQSCSVPQIVNDILWSHGGDLIKKDAIAMANV